jgi:hypothetical protein
MGYLIFSRNYFLSLPQPPSFVCDSMVYRSFFTFRCKGFYIAETQNWNGKSMWQFIIIVFLMVLYIYIINIK